MNLWACHSFPYDIFQGFRAAAEKQVEEASQLGLVDEKSENLEPLRKQAAIIYDQYLSEKVGWICSKWWS